MSAPVAETATVRTDLIRNSHPRSMGHHGDSKDFSPSNAWNDSKTAILRQLPRAATAVLVISREERHCRYTEWVYRQCQEGRVIAPMGLRQCKLALARTQGRTLHCARLRSSKCKFALQRMQTCAAADPALRYANCKLAHRIVHGDGTNGGLRHLTRSPRLALGVISAEAKPSLRSKWLQR